VSHFPKSCAGSWTRIVRTTRTRSTSRTSPVRQSDTITAPGIAESREDALAALAVRTGGFRSWVSRAGQYECVIRRRDRMATAIVACGAMEWDDEKKGYLFAWPVPEDHKPNPLLMVEIDVFEGRRASRILSPLRWVYGGQTVPVVYPGPGKMTIPRRSATNRSRRASLSTSTRTSCSAFRLWRWLARDERAGQGHDGVPDCGHGAHDGRVCEYAFPLLPSSAVVPCGCNGGGPRAEIR